MNLTSPSQVKAWCIENDFHPNKVLGQNFLIDQNALKAIVDAGLDGVQGLKSKCGGMTVSKKPEYAATLSYAGNGRKV